MIQSFLGAVPLSMRLRACRGLCRNFSRAAVALLFAAYSLSNEHYRSRRSNSLWSLEPDTFFDRFFLGSDPTGDKFAYGLPLPFPSCLPFAICYLLFGPIGVPTKASYSSAAPTDRHGGKAC
jgi:hypothetical protein